MGLHAITRQPRTIKKWEERYQKIILRPIPKSLGRGARRFIAMVGREDLNLRRGGRHQRSLRSQEETTFYVNSAVSWVACAAVARGLGIPIFPAAAERPAREGDFRSTMSTPRGSDGFQSWRRDPA